MVHGFWLGDSGDDLTPRPALDGSRRADVVVVGGGYTGLWAAWYLRQLDPALDIVVCEAEIAGFGASGRNGAWLSPGVGVSPGELARRFSPEAARATIEVLRASVDEVARVCDEQGIDARLRRGGILRIARGRHELPALDSGYRTLVDLGLADRVTLLSDAELAERIRIAGAVGAIHDPSGAVVHPGRLVRGLARRVEAAGVTIHEHTPVTSVDPGPPNPRVTTPQGTLEAGAVVLANEAWLSQLPGHRRDLMPLYSLVVLTEPLDDDTWRAIGWEQHEGLSSHRYTVDYLSRTVDGRILFGGRGAPYHYGSRIQPDYDRHEATHADLRRQLTSWFPMLGDIAFTHAWGGPLGLPRDWLPSFRYDPATGIGVAAGYSGQGVLASNLAGRVLADLVVTGDTPFRDLPMVGHRPRPWEPEPLRWLGARYVAGGLRRVDARAARTGRPPTGRGLVERLIQH